MRIPALIILLTVVATAQSAPAQSTSFSVSVAIVDENGVAVPGARVLLQPPNSPAIHCQTNFVGRCQFSAVPPGPYQLRVEKEGFYAVAQESLEASQGENIEVVLSHQQEIREVVNVQESPPAID